MIRPATLLQSAAVAALVVLAGCLPYSCQRTESTSLFPADSLSRSIADSVAADTLDLAWSLSGDAFQFPRTVRYGRGDTIYVADAERRSLFVIVAGEIEAEIPLPVDVPYLAGVTGDTVTVFSPATLTFYMIEGGRVVDSTSVNDPDRTETSLVYGAAGDRLYYKRVDPDEGGFITSPGTTDTTRLEGPHWRHAGLMKVWGDTLLSLSGFRPVVDVVPTDLQTMPDTLALVGFDSPMLARSRSFMKGDVHDPPLLSSSAAVSADRLFVLNMRAGWLQVDVFGRDGMLQRRLVQSDVDYRSSFFPQDVAVRRTEAGYDIAVVYTQPEPALKLFRAPQ